MKCDLCNKKATVHLTEIVDGQMSEMHLCEECAREKSAQMEQQFGLADLLAGLSDFGKKVKEEEKETLLCPECGTSYEDFKKFGRLGCSACYEAFHDNLSVLLKKIHGSNQHLGKAPVGFKGAGVPKKSSPAAKTPSAIVPDSLENYKHQLHRAIEDEDFELAAKLRDKIRELEEQEKKK